MPQLTKKERESKRKVLSEVVETLKSKSFPGNNLLTQENLTTLVNESKESLHWSKPFSIQTLKSEYKKGLGFKSRKSIEEFKEELDKLKKSSDDLLLKKLENLNQKNKSLLEQFVELLDNEMQLKKEIEQLELLVKRKNDEIILLMEKRS